MQPLIFQPSTPYTLGVELEFQLLDDVSLNLAPVAPALLERVPKALRLQIKPEFIQSMVEISTGVCQDMTEVGQDLSNLCEVVTRLAGELDCVPFAASLHPFALVRDRRLSPGPRYSQIMDDLQLAGRRLITQALHVHIGLPDQETAIQVCDSIRPFLPILLALTTSSPYFEGEDSGFQSYRTNLFKTLPRSGIPETLHNYENFQKLIQLLNEATLLNGIKELWWDVRPHPDFGTIEIRICDLPSRFDEILAVTALIQALVVTLVQNGGRQYPQREVMLNNKWHAARYGLAGTFINPHPGSHPAFSQAAAELLNLVHKAAAALGTLEFIEPVHRILQQGTSAQRQRELCKETRDFKTVIDKLREDFWK